MTKRVNSKPQAEEENFGNVAYRRLSEIPGYSPERVGKDFFYHKIENYMNSGRDFYVRCTKEFFYSIRNYDSKVTKKLNVYNENIGYHCIPLERTYINSDGDETVIQYADNSVPNPYDELAKEEFLRLVRSYAKDEKDAMLIECLLDGMDTDIEISKIIGLSRSQTQARRTNLQKLFRENLSDYRYLFTDIIYENKKINRK